MARGRPDTLSRPVRAPVAWESKQGLANEWLGARYNLG